MSFRMHHRKLYLALEAAEGTAQSINPGSDYIECIDPTFTTTARTFERNPTRKSITPAPLHTVGTGRIDTKPSATVEFSFQIELAGSGTAGTAPRWARVLETCGLKKYDARAAPFTGALSQSGGPDVIQTFDTVAVGATVFGRALGDTFNEDSHLFYALKSGGSDPVSGNTVTGSVAPIATLDTTSDSVAAVAYVPTSEDELGGGDLSSATVRLYLDDQGDYIEAVGCRSNVEFAFASGDRVLLNVTMTGRMREYVVGTGTDVLPVSDGTDMPPGFVGVSLNVADNTYEGSGGTDEAAYTGLIFNTMSVNIGNDVVVRENVSTTEGYDVAYITGRSMQMTFNPDAVTNSGHVDQAGADFWDQFLSGDLTRMSFTVGTETGNKFIFRFPAAQFTGIADGNRDETMVWDSSCTLTGGDYGSSIQERDIANPTAATPLNNRLGRDNEFVMFML